MHPLLLAALSASLAARVGSDPRPDRSTSEPALLPSALRWGDYDADGLADAFVLPPGERARLLHNDGDGGFTDVTAPLGLADLAGVEQALWGDADGDGRLDLYIAGPERAGCFLRQVESGGFVDATRAFGLADAPAAIAAEWLDWDGDSDLDLHLTHREGERFYSNRSGEGAGFVQSLVELAALRSMWANAGVEHGRAELGRGVRPAEEAAARTSGGNQPSAGSASAPATRSGASASLGGATEVICVGSLTDQASGACIEASSLPANGFFYPLGTELNIDPAGRVGIGALSNGAKLHVDLAANELVRLGRQGTASEVQMPYGRLRSDHDRFQILGIDALGTAREISLGQASGDSDVTITTTGRLGIGTSSPSQRLDVAGNLAGTGAVDLAGNLSTLRGISTTTQVSPFLVSSSTRVADLNVQYLDGLTASDFSHFGARVDTAELANGAVTSSRLGSDLSLSGDLVVDNTSLAVSSSNNRVGFGTTVPGSKAEVSGNSRVTDDLVVDGQVTAGKYLFAESSIDLLWKNTEGAGVVETQVAGLRATWMNSILGDSGHGSISAYDASGHRAIAYVDSSGQGVLSGDVKNFVADDPRDPSRKIWYASLEGPEAGIYARGTALLVEGEATIELPAHFRESASDRGMTVLTTPSSPGSQGLVVVERSPSRIVVRECLAGHGSYAFDWEVRSGRRGFEDYRVLRPVDEARMSPPVALEQATH